MNDSQLVMAGGLALVGLILLFVGLSMIWAPLAFVAAGVVLVVLGSAVARQRPAE